MSRIVVITFLVFMLNGVSSLFAAELRLGDRDIGASSKRDESESISPPEKEVKSSSSSSDSKQEKEPRKTNIQVIDAGPGFGAHWLDNNSLGFAYIDFDSRNSFPFNDLVFAKLRYDGDLSAVNDIIKIPVGNRVSETSTQFVYESSQRQIGYMASNAADRFGSAHGLQVGVSHIGHKKTRIYLETPYYLNTGYDEIRGVSLAPDSRGFVVSFGGDIYFIPFGDAGSRDTPQISEIYNDSYLPHFDDSTIGAELVREGKNSQYPIYFSNEELLIYEDNDILLYNIRTKATNLVATVGPNVTGVTLSLRTKQISVINKGDIIRYDIAGNELDRLTTGILKARNLSINQDDRYYSFDDIERVYIIEILGEVIDTSDGSKPVVPKRIQPKVAFSCGSADRIMELRRTLEAEINGLKGDVSPARLVGMRKVSAQLRQLANCQSTILRGGSSLPAKDSSQSSVPSFGARSDKNSFTGSATRPTSDANEATPAVKGKFQVLEESGSTILAPEKKSQPREGFRVKKKKKSFNKFRDSPDML